MFGNIATVLGEHLPLAIISVTPYLALLTFVWLVNKQDKKRTKLRVNVLWIVTVVATLTAMFGFMLINRIMGAQEGGGNGEGLRTLDVVLGSLVGGGIGGLLTIAGQLAQEDIGRGGGREE